MRWKHSSVFSKALDLDLHSVLLLHMDAFNCLEAYIVTHHLCLPVPSKSNLNNSEIPKGDFLNFNFSKTRVKSSVCFWISRSYYTATVV